MATNIHNREIKINGHEVNYFSAGFLGQVLFIYKNIQGGENEKNRSDNLGST